MGRKYLLKFILYSILVFGLVYILIWILFIINGPFPLGEDIRKSDWLIFTGGYLTFIGTISISYMVIIQNRKIHELEFEKLRYSQLPYFKFRISNDIKDFKKSEDGMVIIDCPSLVKDKETFKWIDREKDSRALKCPEYMLNEVAVYKIQNIGIGPAMKFKLRTSENVEYDYYDNCKVGESLIFRIGIETLEIKSQNFVLYAHFFDIYNNEYEQKNICKLIIQGTKFTFNISPEQFEPVLIRSIDK